MTTFVVGLSHPNFGGQHIHELKAQDMEAAVMACILEEIESGELDLLKQPEEPVVDFVLPIEQFHTLVLMDKAN